MVMHVGRMAAREPVVQCGLRTAVLDVLWQMGSAACLREMLLVRACSSDW